MKLKPKLVMFFIAVAVIPTALYSVLVFGFTRIYMVRAQFNSLVNISEIKAQAINRYFDNLKQIAVFAQDFYNIKVNLPIMDKTSSTPGDPSYIAAKKMLDGQMISMARAMNLYEIQLFNPDGVLVYSTSNKSETIKGDNMDLTAFEIGKHQVFVGDIHENQDDSSRKDLMVTAPVRDFDGKFVGVLAMHVDLKTLYALISDYTGLGKTGETLIARRTETGDAALFLNPLRHDPDAALKREAKIGDPDALPVQKAVSGQSGAGNSTDYRGEPVLAVWKYLPTLRWGLVTKIDLKEVYTDVNDLAWLFLLGGILTVMAIVLTAFMVSNFIINPIMTLQDVTLRIAKGDLKYRVPVQGKDEIGTLAENFNTMTSKLAESYAGLEEKVRVRTEDLARAKAQDEAILAAIGDGVMACNRKGVVILFNRVAESLSGYQAKEVIGKQHAQFFRLVKEEGHKPVEDFIDKAMRTGNAIKITKGLSLIRRDGDEIPVADSISPVINDQGEKIGCVVVFRDVRSEREIDRMKTEFVSVAAHQLKAPLTAISWLLEAFEGDTSGKLSAGQKKYLADLMESDKKMVVLVNDLLNVSRLEAGKLSSAPQEVRFEELIDEVLREQGPFIAEKKCQVTFDRPIRPLPPIKLDAMLIKQAVNNLVNNAVRYSKPGESRVQLTLQQPPGTEDYMLTVSDNGIGIPKDQQDRIFERFFRAENAQRAESGGSGLGLYITKMVVESAGGRIWFDSQENVGTDFHITLPSRPAPAKTEQEV